MTKYQSSNKKKFMNTIVALLQNPNNEMKGIM